MTPKTLVVAALGGLLLVGCAYPWPNVARRDECNAQHCSVSVTATQHDTTGFSCFVEKAVPEELYVKHARPVIIDWHLDLRSVADGYRFTDIGGIAFADRSEWDCGVIGDGRSFECTDKAGTGSHKYSVHVVKGKTACEALDPFIVNQ
jgi:hypothetical protein